MTSAKNTARTWVGGNLGQLSEWCATIWDFGETAWREYRSSAFYVDILRREGFAEPGVDRIQFVANRHPDTSLVRSGASWLERYWSERSLMWKAIARHWSSRLT